MANHKQAEKRNRQRIKRTERNRYIRQTMRTFIKRVRTHIESGDGAAAKEILGHATKSLDQSVTKGIMPRRTASRTISRLTVAVNKLLG